MGRGPWARCGGFPTSKRGDLTRFAHVRRVPSYPTPSLLNQRDVGAEPDADADGMPLEDVVAWWVVTEPELVPPSPPGANARSPLPASL